MNSKLKILMVSSDFLPNPGGISGHVYEIYKALKNNGCEIDLIAGHNHIHNKLPLPPDITNFNLVINRGFEYSWLGYLHHSFVVARSIKKLTAKINYDLIHYHNLVWEALAVKYGNTKRIPVIFTNHSSGFLRRMTIPWRKKFQLPYLAKQCSGILTPSEELAQKSIEMGFPQSRIIQIPNGVDVDFFKPCPINTGLAFQYHLNNTDPVLIVPRRLDFKNGVDILIRSLPLVKTRFPSIKCLLVGDGEQKSNIQQLAGSLNVSENIIFCGSQPRQDMPKFFNLAKFAVLPSRAEAVSLAGLEAMACGLPVIGSNVGGIPQFVYPNKTGYLFPVENHELLAEQIIHGLLLDDNAYKFLSSSATEFVKSNFSWDIAAIKTIEGYYKILGICGHRPPPSP